MKKARLTLSTSHVIMLGFIAVILLGSLLLWLPISSASGSSVSYIDALFTATTATCVTGLVTLPTVSSWSVFGQAVILVLIQVGGLGIVTVVSGFMLALHKNLGLGDRLLIQDAFNLNSLSGLRNFVKKVICGTFVVEGIGALCYMTVFVRDFGLKGIWISVFNSVSAFCNAGIDIIGEGSLTGYATNPAVNLVTSLLIIIGGIGYIVWWDIVRIGERLKKSGLKALKFLTLHSKIALSATGVLILVGALLFLAFEWSNPSTIGEMSVFDKLQVAFFQSVTTRTAGFATVDQSALTTPSAFVSIILMFIGGSPVGTAGGVKTVTVVILIAFAISNIKGKRDTVLFSRNVKSTALGKAAAVISTSVATAFLSTLLLSAVTKADMLDILYETVSATATVGLSRNLTPLLNNWGKIIIIITMYLGRVGPISLAVALNFKKKSENIIKNPTEDISVG